MMRCCCGRYFAYVVPGVLYRCRCGATLMLELTQAGTTEALPHFKRRAPKSQGVDVPKAFVKALKDVELEP